jgi:hypothetical protein
LEHRIFQIELVIKRENLWNKIITTIVVTIIISLALALMGLDLDMKVVLATLKVCTRFIFQNHL